MASKVLVVDDDAGMREALALRLADWGYRVVLAANAEEALRQVRAERPDVVISDVVMPGTSGHELMRSLLAGDADRPVVLITAHGTVEMAVEAMKDGAYDFLEKPLDHDRLRATLAAAERDGRDRQSAKSLEHRDGGASGFEGFIGDSPAMRKLFDLIREVAATDATVLITGESGTGKELTARAIQRSSRRADGPYVAINAAAVPPELMESEIFGHERGAFTGATGQRRGCFELAHQGTLFLDEISEMPVALQAKLLRVLEDGRLRRLGSDREIAVDVRVVAATNRPPDRAVEDGRLRQDLYYRLNVFALELPPLRQRKSDIPLLVEHFLEQCNRRHGTSVERLADGALDLLMAYRWPGNVRELRNVVERAVIVTKSGEIEAGALPSFLGAEPAQRREVVLPVGTTVAEAERELILKTLEQTGGNKAAAARRLGIDVKTIRNKLKAWDES